MIIDDQSTDQSAEQASKCWIGYAIFIFCFALRVYVTIINLFQLNWRTIVAFGVWKFLIIYHLVGPYGLQTVLKAKVQTESPLT